MLKQKAIAFAILLMGGLTVAAPAQAQDCMIGEIRMFAGNFAPRGYTLAYGQLVNIAGNQALFSILGTRYGGNGRTNFALPDLRGRVAIGAGRGPGLNHVNLGQSSGSEWTQPRSGTAAAGSGARVATSTPISTMQPSTAINYLICTSGIYPGR